MKQFIKQLAILGTIIGLFITISAAIAELPTAQKQAQTKEIQKVRIRKTPEATIRCIYPKISSVSSLTIQPKASLIIKGCGFLSGAGQTAISTGMQTEVRVVGGQGLRVPTGIDQWSLVIKSWTDTSIEATIPEITGLDEPKRVSVIVTTSQGLQSAPSDTLVLIATRAPSYLSLVKVTDNQVRFNWRNSSNDAVGFEIERRTGGAGTFSEIATVESDTISSFEDLGLTPHTTYFYRVRAYNNYGNSDYSDKLSVTTFGVPAVPRNLSGKKVSSEPVEGTTDDCTGPHVLLEWQPFTLEDISFSVMINGIRIERKIDGNGQYDEYAHQYADGIYREVGQVNANRTSYVVPGCAPANSCYRIRAYNSYGNSAYSNEVRVQ